MKTVIVPAQITSVEDRIAGNLSLLQLGLLIAPLFIGGVLYMFLPPLSNLVAYKLVLTVIAAGACAVMALRVKGRVLLLWMVIIMHYNVRPGFYVLNKNDAYLRTVGDANTSSNLEAEESRGTAAQPREPELSAVAMVELEKAIGGHAGLLFRPAKKGGLRVTVTEVK